MNIVVRTYAGFEDILAREVNHITGITPNIGKRAVYLEGGKKEIYLLNLWCLSRKPSRICWKVHC